MSAVHTLLPTISSAVPGVATPTSRPAPGGSEVADIFRTYGEAYRATHRLSGQQLRGDAGDRDVSHGGLGGPHGAVRPCGPRSCGTTRVAIATVPSAKPWPSCAGSRHVAQSF